jgi:hypothetical protein
MAQRPGQPVVKIAHVLKRIKTTGRALGSSGSNEVVAKLPAAFRQEVRRRPQLFHMFACKYGNENSDSEKA